MKQHILFLIIVIFSFCSFAQTQLDSIQRLEEVTLSDNKLKNYASGFKVTTLNDSILLKNQQNLTNLLAFNSNIYFKETGFGMVSSPSFRGTNASQTAVIWNGININSQLNGQTDFNLINTTNFNSVTIRSGGGGVQYGSGSIGGTVHLNNKLQFKDHFDNTLRASYGSFDTKQFTALSDFGNDKFSGNIGLSYVDSKNDYKFIGTDKVNENGAFNNRNINANFGYFISNKDVIKLYHQTFIGERNLSATLVAPSQSAYKDTNLRNMLEWSRLGSRVNSKLKIAHLHEEFKYFENKNKEHFSFGKVNTLILKHNLNFRVSKSFQLHSVLEYNTIDAKGSSFGNPNRQVFSVTGLMKHKPAKSITYGLNFRKDFTSKFTSPFVFSIDSKFKIANAYTVKLNASKNYRVPTFNDLFWQPGGNLNLMPESSYQIDLGQEFRYKQIEATLNAYYISTQDLIQWRPNILGVWSPVNIAEAENYGMEMGLGYTKQINEHTFKLNGNYSYTISEDKSTNKQLIYVPFHKANANLAYGYKGFSAFYQHLFNGEVFIISRDKLPYYNVGNLGLGYHFNSKGRINYLLEFRVNNIFDAFYENVALRPMPNRNFQIQTTIKF
ncbi:TonB-dependent receptor plug domain-containing protein [Lacinutrix chionoecetis]